jgi:hypothetical protein
VGVSATLGITFFFSLSPDLFMADEAALIDSNIPDLKLLSKGKVRDIYATSSPDHLLFVASDRISAYDIILKNVNSSPALTRSLYFI